MLADLVRFGAPADITVESRPHVGSNRLPKVLSALRLFLEERGVSYRFSSRFSDIVVRTGKICAVRTAAGDEIAADIVLLASGHSARDVYAWAARAGIALERKGSAVGVRLEHPQPIIDRIQYGAAAGDPRLPPAFYETSALGERAERVQLLHVPRRLHRAGRDRARRRGGERHEPLAPRFSVRQRRDRRGRRTRATSASRRSGRWPASSSSAASNGPPSPWEAAGFARPRNG